MSLGDIGVGLPNKTGATSIVIAPLTYMREDVNMYTGFQSHLGVGTEQDVGARVALLAGAKAGIDLGAGGAVLDTSTRGEQSSLGTFVSAQAGARIAFADAADIDDASCHS